MSFCFTYQFISTLTKTVALWTHLQHLYGPSFHRSINLLL